MCYDLEFILVRNKKKTYLGYIDLLLVLDGGVRDPHDLPVGHVHLHGGLGVPQVGALPPLLQVVLILGNKSQFCRERERDHI